MLKAEPSNTKDKNEIREKTFSKIVAFREAMVVEEYSAANEIKENKLGKQ